MKKHGKHGDAPTYERTGEPPRGEDADAPAEQTRASGEPLPESQREIDEALGRDHEDDGQRGDSSGQQEPPRPRQPTYVETLERRLQETQDQLREYIQAYKQVKEDKDDFKRRLDREKQKELDVLRGKLVSELIEVLDNLDRSVMGGESGWNAQSLLQGIKMVQGQFLEKLQGLGLQAVDPQGLRFDPNEAEAMDVSLTDDPDRDNTVSRVYSRGYRLNDRVIRPARVQVARYAHGDA